MLHFVVPEGASRRLLTTTTLLLLLKAVVCVPTSHIIPQLPGLAHIAHDEKNGRLVTLRGDGSLYRRFPEAEMGTVMNIAARAPTSCTSLSVDDLKKLPGFAQIDKYFRDTYGTGSANIVTNPPEYPDSGAVLCADTASIPVVLSGQPTCTSAKAKVEGQLDGTTGTLAITFSQGYSNKGTWTVDTSSSIGTDVKLSASLELPGVGELGGSVSTSATFTNSLSTSFSTNVDTTNSQTLTVEVPSGKQCYGQLDTKTCNVGGKAQIPLIASGWVWYNFDDQTAPKGSDDKHYKWTASIESILKDVKDRSTQVSVTGSMEATSKSNYHAVCD